LLTLILSGCAGARPLLKVGLVAPFEGRHRELGYDVIYSARLAVRELNLAGGVSGYYLALVSLDDGGEVDLAQGAAASLVVDPAVVAVVGHWLPGTTTAAAPIYSRGGLPLIRAGEFPFQATEPASLPQSFRARYEAVTPFDEVAGPYAAAAYDAFQLLRLAIETAAQNSEQIDRAAIDTALRGVEHPGLSGTVFWPAARRSQ
jgi:ABC-type branched-subunit amino acid transport system substrate-binding protein